MNNSATLVKEAKGGNAEAFVRLIDMHRQPLYSAAIAITHSPDDAMDAVSETILSCWEHLPGLRENRHFKTWMTRILINKCYDILCENRRYAPISVDIPAAEGDPELSMQIEAYMQSLRENDRLILTLFYFEDYSIRQISGLLGISASAVKTRLSRSRQSFKKIYLKGEEASLKQE